MIYNLSRFGQQLKGIKQLKPFLIFGSKLS